VRGNSASNIQITGNSISDVREVALYSEFSFEGAVIANNTVDGAALGVSVCNFNEGGRLAVVQGNIIATCWRSARSAQLRMTMPASVSMSRPIPPCQARDRERALVRDRRGLGQISARRRDHRQCDPQRLGRRRGFGDTRRGHALVNNNMISQTPRGAVVGLDHARPITSDLSVEGAQPLCSGGVGQ